MPSMYFVLSRLNVFPVNELHGFCMLSENSITNQANGSEKEKKIPSPKLIEMLCFLLAETFKTRVCECVCGVQNTDKNCCVGINQLQT
jgi:hypothetical protein